MRYWVVVLGLAFTAQILMAVTQSGWDPVVITSAVALAFILGEEV